MDILIKNMEMPKGCEGCPLCFLSSDGRNFFCTRQIGKRFDLSLAEQRQEDCPLIPVPEHGDLIDRDKEIDEWEQTRRVLSECEQKHTFEYRKACVVINALSQAEVVLERTT